MPVILDGLHHLEYRGYDSSGLAYIQHNDLYVVRAKGKLVNLEDKLTGEPNLIATTGIGHTRWATHGEPVERNAHPHQAGNGMVAVVHNGIIENYQELRNNLLCLGYRFTSDTDTEVLACLIVEELKKAPCLAQAFALALSKARGAYAVAVLCKQEPNVIYAARQSAPLILGVGVGETFVASDIPAFLSYTRQVVFLEDGEIVRISGSKWQIFSLADQTPIRKELQYIQWDTQAAAKGGYKHFMLKEIIEQPRVITDCLAGRLMADAHDLRVLLPELDGLSLPKRLRIIACGTSFNAGLWGRQFLEEIGGIPTEVEIGSEFRYRHPILNQDDLILVISQSGETLDTMSALRLAKEKGCRVISLCNVIGSSIARESDAVIYTQAGPEISVASTKAMCSQMLLLLLLAAYFGQRQGLAPRKNLLHDLQNLSAVLEEALPTLQTRAEVLAKSYSTARSFFYLGRGPCYALALEGALKLKELSYIHAEGYAAGEMKHGPIALIDPLFPTFAIALNDELLSKVKSNIVEIKARQGKVIALTQPSAGAEVDADDIWQLPACRPELAGFFALSAMQLFSYKMADYLGKDVDQPRNLAKSVTVE